MKLFFLLGGLLFLSVPVHAAADISAQQSTFTVISSTAVQVTETNEISVVELKQHRDRAQTEINVLNAKFAEFASRLNGDKAFWQAIIDRINTILLQVPPEPVEAPVVP